ncbi:XDD3 family exosortase-dependent surface protein [Calothrix sp. UHCC 0171]|uniref:XDD3 family exosortase-dependent surface protein n=1 Tax=Calothrix sp. UHCC 0171 TaxID=3110245 RepID=UPI002B1F4C8A|nr:XDD3 family exosortase-dependent surface protein [Calothrix sp. UHCC 0171]MEA5573018.1 XDD3 family exosortase-dependent surface protein [Calothrix sp. UHCC 0171]
MPINCNHQTKSKQLINSLFFILPLAFILAGQKASFAADWMYARDAVGDYLSSSTARDYDIFGIGIKDDGDNVFVGINSNMSRDGYNVSQRICSGGQCYNISNGNIGWGDLFFDFSGNREFGTSNDNRQLFGVRFAPGNDSKVGLGIYNNVYGVGVQGQNAGYLNFGRHYNSLPTQQQKQTTNVGDLAWNDSYWGSRYTYSGNREAVPNVIALGDRIGDVELLDSNSLYAAGFGQGLFQGSQLFGFKFSRSLLPSGNFIASLFEECLNDAIALRGRFDVPIPKIVTPPQPPVTLPPIESVPEPSAIAGLIMVALLGGKRVLRLKRI